MAQLRTPKHPAKLLLKLAALVIFILGVSLSVLNASSTGFFIHETEQSSAQTLSVTEVQAQSIEEAPVYLVVHVDGAVMVPGVYELEEGLRVNDAIALAGGLTAEADTSSINLAAVLVDAQKIYVPEEGEGSSSVSASEGGTSTSTLININTATAEELDTLPGIGPSTAATIIQDRLDSGPFTSIEDIMRISGIGEKKFAKFKDYICV